MAHTPEVDDEVHAKMPWQYDEFGILRDADGEYIGDLYDACIPRKLWPAIAAAPECLAMLKECLRQATRPMGDGGLDLETVAQAQALVAKSEGR